MKSFLTAGFALATCAAFAAIPTQTFEGEKDTTIWFGDCTVSSGVLAVEGTAICSNATAAVASEFVKTSFKVKAPEDETTELPTGDELRGCQIAIATGAATGTNNEQLKVMVYAITNANEAGWADTGLAVATGTEFTVTLSFDYMQTNVTVQIDRSSAGPYTLVTPPANNATYAKINSLNFVGSTEIDDVGINEAVAKSSMTGALADLQGLTVYTNEVGMTLEEIASSSAGSGGLTAAQRIEAGLTATDATASFTATALTTVTEYNTVKTVITVPCDKDYGQVYQVEITDNAGKAISESPVSATAGAIANNTRELTFLVPETDEKVLKFNVVAKAPGSSN